MEKNNTTTSTDTESKTQEINTTATAIQPTSASTDTTSSTTQAPASGTLPAGYLADGSMLDAEGIMRPEYLEKHPQELAQRFEPLSASSFQRAFLSKAKEANKKKVPYSVKKNCAQGMVIQAMKLTHRQKDPAPAVLLDMIRAATASVVDDSTFAALCLHLDAICTYMMMAE